MTGQESAKPRARLTLARPDRRDVLLGALLAAIGGASVVLRPTSRLAQLGSAKLDAAVPRTLGPWSVATTDGLVTAPSDELSAKLYDQILTRVYRGPGVPDHDAGLEDQTGSQG